MLKNKVVNKGVVLLLVIGTITIIVILCSFFLRIMLSQYKLTAHQTSRVQAYYAGLAGMNWALDQLRRGILQYSVSPAVNSCANLGDCVVTDDFGTVNVIFCPATQTCPPSTAPCNPPPGTTFCINSTATYTNPGI